MITETSIIDVGGSLYTLIPKQLVDYFELKPGTCEIEDLSKNKAELVFR
jgi:hypothetical protein